MKITNIRKIRVEEGEELQVVNGKEKIFQKNSRRKLS